MTKLLLHAFPALCSAGLLWGGVSLAAQGQTLSTALADGAGLVSACRAAESGHGPDGARLCDGYLLGYFEANPAILLEGELPSPYMQRVLRTRAPDHPQVQAVNAAEYCLPDQRSLVDVRASIAQFDPGTAAGLTPAAVIQQVLERDHRCRP